MSSERREYFRIQDMAFVKAKPWSENQTSLPEYFPEFRSFNLFHELDQLDQKNANLAEGIADKPSLKYLEMINSKLDILGKALTISQLNNIDIAPQRITISEGGIGFCSDIDLAPGSDAALMLIFTPAYMTLFIRTKIVNCRFDDGKYYVHGEFNYLPEETRQSLAKHLLMMQTKQREKL